MSLLEVEPGTFLLRRRRDSHFTARDKSRVKRGLPLAQLGGGEGILISETAISDAKCDSGLQSVIPRGRE
jgi:hypothetical protein